MSRQELETPTVSPYGWLITHDELTADNDSDDVHTTGPSRISEQVEEALHKDVTPHGFRRAEFRMYDDDGILYYRGRMFYREGLEGTEVQVFGPLQDFGLPHAGCTRIRWNDNDHYETY